MGHSWKISAGQASNVKSSSSDRKGGMQKMEMLPSENSGSDQQAETILRFNYFKV